MTIRPRKPASEFMRPRRSLLSTVVATILGTGAAQAQELPVPCGAGACGSGPVTWVTDGQVTGTAAGGTFRINQVSDSATLNWASFNIGADARVVFDQPDASAVALNRIFQADPSRIFGALEANGQIFLLNQNGFIFGEGATVNVGSLVATSLDLTPAAVADGIIGAGRSNEAAFTAFTDADGNPVTGGSIRIENGALLGADEGRILIFAPEVTNLGRIETPDGQTILAAGDKIYLAAPGNDSNIRGLLVEVDGEGVVSNGDGTLDAGQLLGEIVAERGNVTLAGLAVNQMGRVSATTSVRQNGSIVLQARSDGEVQSGGDIVNLFANLGGTLNVASGSITEVSLDLDDPAATVDVNVQPQSTIAMDGETILIGSGAEVRASSGNIRLTARTDQRVPVQAFDESSDASRIAIEAGAVLDVSGAETTRSVSDNVIEVELRGNQLADSPVQRDSDIRSETVLVDIRQRGVRADGSEWQGTPLADASGEISNIERTVTERNLAGGSIDLQSQGDVIVAEGAVLDVSGGFIDYSGGDVTTSQLLGADGRVYNVADADRDRVYTAIVDSFTVEHPRWGITEVFSGFRRDNAATFEAGYREGYDAGSISLLTPRFLFGGTVVADTYASRYQRALPTAIPAGSLYRPFDQLPLGAALTIGNPASTGQRAQFVTNSLVFADAAYDVATTTALSAGILGFEFAVDHTNQLDVGLFGSQRVTRADIGVNGTAQFDSSLALSLPASGRLSIVSGGVQFDGRFTAPAGEFSLASRTTSTDAAFGGIGLGSSAVIDVAGRWVNDNPFLGNTSAPLAINGGSVSLSATTGGLRALSGSVIDVSGGAQFTVGRELRAGTAGDITLVANALPGGVPAEFELGAQLRGFALEQGGALAINANAICIDATDCRRDDGELWLLPSVFYDQGFQSVALTSNLTGLRVTGGTQIVGQQRNFRLRPDTQLVPSGARLADLATVGLLPELDRRPVNLSLTADVSNDATVDFTQFEAQPGLFIAPGSRLDFDPGAAIRLDTDGLLVVDGRIRAPSGSVALTVNNSLIERPNAPAGGIWLTNTAAIDVSGIERVLVNDAGRRIGRVTDAGSIDMVAERSGIFLASGAELNISGATGLIDVPTGDITNPNFERREIASNGGSLSLAAAEYIFPEANVDASARRDLGAIGGSLSISIDGNLRGTDLPIGANGLPLVSLNQRRIRLVRDRTPIVLPVGAPAPESGAGTALISAEFLEDAGFHSVALDAVSLFAPNPNAGGQFLAETGLITLDGGVNLTLPGSISLNAANILGGSGAVNLAADYVAIGHRNPSTQDIAAPVQNASGELTINANLVDFEGRFGIDGFDTVSVSSAGDLRLRGVQFTIAGGFGVAAQDQRAVIGELTTLADLNLTAAQIYPTTLSDFTLRSGRADGNINVFDAGTEATTVLSAGGTLTLAAGTITSNGMLRAPFGNINLEAQQINLGDGSVTSTSLDGAIVPFGTVQAGLDWTYGLLASQTLVFDGELNDLPRSDVRLAGDDITLADGATIDISAGGDLLAYEFISGIGGTDDFLLPETTPGLFALLPGSDIQFAPVDPLIAGAGDDGLRVGDTVFLNGIGDIGTGTYTLLPARYALLPGAVLVRAVDGFADILPGQQFAGRQGSVVVSGRLGNRDGLLEQRSRGIELLPRSRAFSQSSYTLATATEFFAGQDVRTPRDAGAVTFAANQALSLEGSLVVAVDNGRGAQVNIASEQLSVVNERSADAATVELIAGQLSALNAERLTIGGVTTRRDDADNIAVVAREVVVADGVELTAPSILLVASDTLTVGADARVSASGPELAAVDYTVDGDAALVSVSASSATRVERSNDTGAAGDINLASGAVLAADGSILIDGSRDVTIDGSLDIGAGQLSLGASQVSVGNSPADLGGLRLTDALLTDIAADELIINARGAISVFGDAFLRAGNELDINALGFDAATAAASLTVSARNIGLFGIDAFGSSGSAGIEAGLLALDASTLTLGDNRFSLSGFASSSLSVAEQINVTGSGSLVATGALDIDSPLVRIAGSADYTLAATDALSVTGSTSGSGALPTDGPGGLLTLAGNTTFIDTRIDGESARLGIVAAGDVLIGERAQFDLTGLSRDFAGTLLTTPAGTFSATSTSGDITLQNGAVIDVSGSADGAAGTIRLNAPVGRLAVAADLNGNSTSFGGQFYADAAALGNVDALLATIRRGGFADTVALRQRGGTDLAVSSNRLITANRIALTSDSASVRVDGQLIGEGSGARIDIAAAEDISIAGSLNLAGSSVSDARVSLSSTRGRIALQAGSGIDTGENGTVNIALSRTQLANNLNADASDDGLVSLGSINAGAVRVEGQASYQDVDGVLTAAETAASAANPLFADAVDFMATAPQLEQALGGIGAPIEVLPGIIIASDGDLRLADEFNLFDWRFADDRPGVLTLRAAGDLTFSAPLNDGFANAAEVFLTDTGDSWSYRLIGGADTTSSDLLATVADPAAGDVTIEAGTPGSGRSGPQLNVVRTGNGAIDVAAAGDIVFGNQASVLYTAGIATSGVQLSSRGDLGRRDYPDMGGDISLAAGRDIVGATSNQLFTGWLWRAGVTATGWTVSFGNFEQNVAALGGGNIDVVAGNDIVDFSASIPSIGRQVGDIAAGENVVEVIAGGNLALEAGGDILGGSYLVGLGDARLSAGGRVGTGSNGFAPFLALGDASITLDARKDLEVAAIVSPTLLPIASAQLAPATRRSFFSTYSPTAGVTLRSLNGDVSISNISAASSDFLASYSSFAGLQLTDLNAALTLAPARFQANAFAGDINIAGNLNFLPSPFGTLDLLAEENVTIGNLDAGIQVFQSDADPALVPSVATPAIQNLSVFAGLFNRTGLQFNASTPVFAAVTGLNRIVARTGDVSMISSSSADAAVLYSARPIQIDAGRDIVNLGLFAQNLDAASVTSLTAGRDIIYSSSREDSGRLQGNEREIRIAGPGNVLLRAGRDIDFQTSDGLVTSGDIDNIALPEGGASVSLLAGLAGQEPAYATFFTTYLVDSSAYDSELIAFVSAVSDAPVVDKAAALDRYATLAPELQSVLVERVLFAELRASGREAANPGELNNDFTRGFTALTTLFPGANPDLEAGATNVYAGDVALFFSRVYTLDGGSINFLVPGGEVNAGLASPPSAFGIQKEASDLGVVAQGVGDINSVSFGDLAVNESRVFAADGGDILIWSTRGDIDAGRGAKTAISAPPPQVSIDPENGSLRLVFPAALTGSGIQTIATSEGREPGNVDLFAPRGVVNAGDAGIVAGNLTVAAVAVLGADNIDVSGVAIGVPVDTAVAPGLTSVADTGAAANQAAQAAIPDAGDDEASDSPLADAALGFLDVFVVGFGDCDPQTGENCEDTEQ